MATDTTTKDTQNEAHKGDRGGKVFRGTVVSTKMQNTVTVAVERYVKHPKYKKYMRRTKKYLADTAGKSYNEGDTVAIQETTPISKKKRFRIVQSGSE